VCALSYFLEREGIMTTGISLVRENTESMKPPRALWVSFPLGRPLGIPGETDFQHEVIAAALDLLNRSGGPVLEDFPKDIPAIETDNLASCPVAFPKKTERNDYRWSTRLARELELLKPWYELSLRRRNGRTLVAVSTQTPEQNIVTLGQHLDDEKVPTDVKWLKSAVEDLKAYYNEAMTAQPGEYDAKIQQAQFWQETTLGAAILVLYRHFQNAEDDRFKSIARILAPREAVGETTGPQRGKSID